MEYIYIEKEENSNKSNKIIVKHIRTEYIIIDNGGKNPVGSFKGNNENIPKITYELEFIFDKTFIHVKGKIVNNRSR